jgi:WD40 repeat protein
MPCFKVTRRFAPCGAMTEFSLSPDEAVLLSGSEDESARLWDLASGGQLALFPLHGAAVAAVAFSPDGKLIATATRDGSVHIWYARAVDLKQEARSRLPRILRRTHLANPDAGMTEKDG